MRRAAVLDAQSLTGRSLMKEKVWFIFWDGSFQLLSNGPLGSQCGSRQEAIQLLYDRIAAHESTIGYLNQIYDNAQVEMQPDNLQEVTVRGAYDIQDIYVRQPGSSIADTVLSYLPQADEKPIGMAYACKEPTGEAPDFESALQALMAEMTQRGRQYLAQEKKLFEDT